MIKWLALVATVATFALLLNQLVTSDAKNDDVVLIHHEKKYPITHYDSNHVVDLVARKKMWDTPLRDLIDLLDCLNPVSVSRVMQGGYDSHERATLHYDGYRIPIAVHADEWITKIIKGVTPGSTREEDIARYFEINEVFKNQVKNKAPPGGNGAVVLDVGANVGVFSLYAAATGWPVISVEASELNAKRLQESIGINNFDKVTLFRVAAGRELKCAPMQIGWQKDNLGSNSLAISTDSNKDGVTQNTVMMPLEYLIDPTLDIAIFKLDVEGFECEALRGAHGLFKRKQVQLLFVEVNEPMLKFGGCSKQELKEILNDLCMDTADFDKQVGSTILGDFIGRPKASCHVQHKAP